MVVVVRTVAVTSGRVVVVVVEVFTVTTGSVVFVVVTDVAVSVLVVCTEYVNVFVFGVTMQLHAAETRLGA